MERLPVAPAVDVQQTADIGQEASDLHGGSTRNDTFYGPRVRIGKGTGRAFVTTGRKHRPVELGILLTDDALCGLPVEFTEYLLPLPRKGAAPPFTHLVVDWEPHGHPPPGVYDVPHFDFHFYMITPKERAAIDGSTGGQNPSPEFVPAHYVSTFDVVPQMGVHWIDTTAPELRPGGTFTRTFIYGYYQGGLAFFEPMATLAFLKTRTNKALPIPQPAAYQRSGFYPTQYRVTSRRDRVLITLEKFVSREGTLVAKK